MRLIPCPLSAEALRSLYVNEKLTDLEIAERCHCSVKHIRRWRHRYGIETMHRTDRYEVLPIEGRLRSLLVGSMLGDGRLDRLKNTTRYMENHSERQEEYLRWKAGIWGPWVQSEVKPVMWHRPEGDFPGYRFETVAHHALNEWHTRFYAGGTRKLLTREALPFVDVLSLAIWYMDDGSAGWWPRITFGMDSESQGLAVALLIRFGFQVRWEVHKGNTGEFLFEGEEQALRFIDTIKPHMPKFMHYKLQFGFQGPHYQVRQALTEATLRDLAKQGTPIKRMAKELGQSPTTIDRYLREYGIPHPRKIGRPPRP